MQRLIGSRAEGVKKDMSYRRQYYGDFPRGSKTMGEITKYDPVSRKYLIEGACYIFNETGEFQISNMTGDWYSRSQIEILED